MDLKEGGIMEDTRYQEAEELKEVVIGFFERLARIQEQIDKEKAEAQGESNG